MSTCIGILLGKTLGLLGPLLPFSTKEIYEKMEIKS